MERTRDERTSGAGIQRPNGHERKTPANVDQRIPDGR